MLRTDLCDDSDTYNVAKGTITVERDDKGDKKRNKENL